MVDRREGDALGNVAEVRRLAEGATDLRVVATWPDGGGAADLARAAAADVVISLPYGRRAARDLATATGATLVEAPLPVGLGATRAFVGTLADALDTRPRADDFAARETDEAVRAVLPFGLRRFRDAFGAWLGDPLLAPGVTEWLADLGCRVDVVGATVRRVRHRVDAEPRGASAWAMRWAPDLDAFCDAVVDSRRHAARFFGVVPDAIDLPGRLAPAPAVLSELGFPSIDAHAVATRPYYGFRGLATLVERLGGLR
jgi:nitrogenase molybdenum-iron protein alpha/beta subunit